MNLRKLFVFIRVYSWFEVGFLIRGSRAKCLDQLVSRFFLVGKFFSNFGRQILEKDDERKIEQHENKNHQQNHS